jgi:hypothetical protein
MNTILVNAPTGKQELITIGPGGGYFDASRVIWDTRTDGALPAITLGGMVRNGNALAFDQARMDEHLAPERAAVWESIKALRDQKVQTGGYTAGGKWFHSDTFSRTQQMALFMMGAAVPAVQWKTMDGTFVTMTQTLAGQIFAAGAAKDQGLFARAEVLRAAVYAAADPASVDITAGWPAGYGE